MEEREEVGGGVGVGGSSVKYLCLQLKVMFHS